MFTPTSQSNPPSSPYYDASVSLPPRNVAAAKALLKQAGVAPPVVMTLTIPDNPDLLQAGQVIQVMARDAGFAVKIQAMEFASSLQAGCAGNFQAYMIRWSGRSDPDGSMWQILHAGGTFNYGHYSDPLVDKALDEARLYTDLGRRRSIYATVWQRECKDLPLLYLWAPKNIVGMKTSLEGFVQIPDGIIRLQGLHFAP
jgi:peptide/nickel transport system substrate-binding protein